MRLAQDDPESLGGSSEPEGTAADRLRELGYNVPAGSRLEQLYPNRRPTRPGALAKLRKLIGRTGD